MPAHLVLIDAMNLIRRIFAVQERPFAMQDELSAATQSQIIENTVINCHNALKKILSIHQPSHALLVFDSEAPCWRYSLYPDYKKGRKKMPQYLADNLARIQDDFLDLNVDSLVPEVDEADDIIATLACKVAMRQQNVTIISTDKSFLSLLNSHIAVYDYFNRKYLDEYFVVEKFAVRPSQLIDLWTLTGDTTNKIPGVPGIGAVTAKKLLEQYVSLDALLAATDLKQSVKQKLRESQAEIDLSRKLLQLKTDIPLGFNLKDIRLDQKQQPAELDC